MKKKQNSKNTKYGGVYLNNSCDYVVYKITTFLEPKDALALSRINKIWSENLCRKNVFVWKQILLYMISDTSNISELNNIPFTPNNYKAYIALHCDIGCELCGKPRIRKVTTEFHRRLCKECLHSNTISDYALKCHDLKISDFIESNIPHTTVDMWGGKYVKMYTLKFFWKDDVNKVILNKYHKTFDEYIAELEHQQKIKEDERIAKLLAESIAQKEKDKLKKIADDAKNKILQEKYDNLAQIRAKRLADCQHIIAKFADYKILQQCESFCKMINIAKPWNENRTKYWLNKIQPEYDEIDETIKIINLRESQNKIRFKNEMSTLVKIFESVVDANFTEHVSENIWKLNLDIILQSQKLKNQFHGDLHAIKISYFKCSICAKSERTFRLQGLLAHALDSHVKENRNELLITIPVKVI
jgi:hypothetical protein